MSRLVRSMLGLACAFIGIAPALAHHSYAMFNDAKTLSLTGTVKIFQWTNPHIWVQISVSQGQSVTDWRLEGGPIAQLKNIGWSHDVIKPGDRVTIVTHPLKDGSSGGALMWITLPNGKRLQGGGTVAQKTLPDADVIEH